MVLRSTREISFKKNDTIRFAFSVKSYRDQDVMYAYEGAFSIDEVQNWLDKQMRSYKEYGFGLMGGCY